MYFWVPLAHFSSVPKATVSPLNNKKKRYSILPPPQPDPDHWTSGQVVGSRNQLTAVPCTSQHVKRSSSPKARGGVRFLDLIWDGGRCWDSLGGREICPSSGKSLKNWTLTITSFKHVKLASVGSSINIQRTPTPRW